MACKNLIFQKYIYIKILFYVVVCIFPMLVSADIKQKQCITHAKFLKKSGDITFVDVRDKKFFNEKHISSSINIPLDLIKTKAFLKNKLTVIVGNGWNEHLLIDECIQLKKKEFKSVKVLAGGIISWFKIQKELSKRTLISLTSKEFFNNKIEKNFVPFVISDKNKKRIKTTLPHAKIYSFKTTKKQFLNGLARLGKGVNPIVIFSDKNPIIDEALNEYLKKPLRKIYYFEGGYNAYHKVSNLNKMTAASNQHKRLSTKKPVSCAN